MKRALVTGITGQDGSYLAELLLASGYEVHGVIRRASSFNTGRIDHLYKDPHESGVRLHLHYGDLTDGSQRARLIRTVRPDEIYNLGAQSHVMVSFEQPEYTGDVSGLGVTRLLEAIRETGAQTRRYQAASSEMFGDSPPQQSERTPFRPRSHMQRRSCTPTGLLATTERRTACTRCQASSSTTRASAGVKRSSRGRSQQRSPGSSPAYRAVCTWGTLMRSGTGATLRTMCGRCT